MTGTWYDSMACTDSRDWLNAGIFYFAALASVRAARHAGLARVDRERVFWCASGAMLAFLSVNEVLDLQAALTDLGRVYAKAFGWYGHYRRLQHLFFAAFGLAIVSTALAVIYLARRTSAPVRIALLGHSLIALFIVERAAAITHMDDIVGMAAVDQGGALLELTGPLIVSAAAMFYAQMRRGSQPLP